MKNIILFLNTKVGYEVANFLLKDNNIFIDTVFLCNQYPEIDNKIESLFKDSKTKLYRVQKIDNLNGLIQKNTQISFLICVYWPYLLNIEILKKADNNINFHPALLPINRGWYPHVHSIIDGSKAGVTLHEMNELADQGDILVQKEINIPEHFCAKEVYEMLQDEMIDLFYKNWSLIKKNKVEKIKQNEKLANYHKKNEVNDLNFVDIQKKENKNLINLLRARSFGEKGFAYFLDKNGEKIFLTLKLKKNEK